MDRSLLWTELLILLLVAALGGLGGAALTNTVRSARYSAADVGGLMVCKNPNEVGRLECLVLPQGSVILVPKVGQQKPVNVEVK